MNAAGDMRFIPLETRRLRIVPLSARQLAAWTGDIAQLERGLGCVYQAEPMTGVFHEIVLSQLAAVQKADENALWHTFWLLIRRADHMVVGSADFKGPPNAQGEVELGYGLGEKFEHNGYMTEATRAMCAWALAQAGAEAVLAETERDNLPSQRVLGRCGFALYARGETLWWRLPRGAEETHAQP